MVTVLMQSIRGRIEIPINRPGMRIRMSSRPLLDILFPVIQKNIATSVLRLDGGSVFRLDGGSQMRVN